MRQNSACILTFILFGAYSPAFGRDIHFPEDGVGAISLRPIQTRPACEPSVSRNYFPARGRVELPDGMEIVLQIAGPSPAYRRDTALADGIQVERLAGIPEGTIAALELVGCGEDGLPVQSILASMRKQGGLRKMHFARCNVGPRGLDSLREFGALETMCFEQTGGAPDMYDGARGQPSLRQLVYDESGFDNAAEWMSSLPNLEEAVFRFSYLTKEGIESLGRCKSLRRLKILQTQRDVGNSISSIGHLSDMTDLAMTSIRQASPSDFSFVSRLRRLRSLWLDENELTDAQAEEIAKLGDLQVLRLYGNHLTDAGVAHFSKLINLEELDIRANEITDRGVAHLCELPKLKRLSLSRTKISDASADTIESMDALEWLELGYESPIRTDRLNRLQATRPNLVISLAETHPLAEQPASAWNPAELTLEE